ncbi:MAG: HlyD family type I secretion periplasmic adaptor subunit, partial [Gammaproteobacteria bacterium]
DYLSLEQERIEHVQDLKALERQSEELTQTVAEAKAERDRARAAFRAELLREQTELTQRRHGLSQELAKAEKRNALQQLTAPVWGVVQQLSVHTVGGVVTPAQPLMTIVPTDAGVQIEAFFEDKDIGFLEPAQTVEVKVDALPCTKYGMLAGRLDAVSKDAVEQEGAGWIFPAQISLHRTDLNLATNTVSPTPGMAVAADVSTGKRRPIDFVLAPLLRYGSESARER